MPIPLDESRPPSLPVVKRKRIGEHFVGAVVRYTQRDRLKDGAPVMNDKGRPRQELVVTCVAMPGTDAVAGIGDEEAMPQPGDLVRVILKSKAFADWIDAKRSHGALSVGDVLEQVMDRAQQYDADGKAVGHEITTQAALDKVPRGRSVGVYGPLTLRQPTPAEREWVTRAEEAYHATAPRVALDLEEPF